MYLPSSEPVIAEFANRVAASGFLAAAVRTTTSALWRPAAHQDWSAALAAFEKYDAAHAEQRDMRYVNEIGTPARADDLSALEAIGIQHGLRLENWYGVRIAVDAMNSILHLRPTRTNWRHCSMSRSVSARPIRIVSSANSLTSCCARIRNAGRGIVAGRRADPP